MGLRTGRCTSSTSTMSQLEELFGGKPYEVIGYQGGDAFQFYYDLFTRDGTMVDDSKYYDIEKAAFLEKYQEKLDPGTISQLSLEAHLHIEDPEESLSRLEQLYEKANFNEEANCAMIQKAVNEILDLAGIALCRSASTLEELKKDIRYYDKARSMYRTSNHIKVNKGNEATVRFVDDKGDLESNAPRILVRPDARMKIWNRR